MAKQLQASAENAEPEGRKDAPPGFNFKEYNAVVQSAKLLDIRMTSSHFDVKSEYFVRRDREKEENKSLMNLGMGCDVENHKYSKEQGLVAGNFTWSAYGKTGRKKILSVKANYLVIYSSRTDLDEKYVEAFLSNVGKFATFPYFRSLVATYSAASSADLPILPVLKEPIGTPSDDETAKA